jgi:hypothetical protein
MSDENASQNRIAGWEGWDWPRELGFLPGKCNETEVRNNRFSYCYTGGFIDEMNPSAVPT